MSNINATNIASAKELGGILRLLRTEQQLSLRQVAAESGISIARISRLENNVPTGHLSLDELFNLLTTYDRVISL